eukprot:TRINITY_DN314_c0_g4_i1.p1 TRINITY_DN314_c0_g4~~TRINITY_DN314_c0_g4_i1.p1  ORF type:complete len:297 (+),score=34.75 TRINITY_DN314_c0_g4_i1:65-955(+)
MTPSKNSKASPSFEWGCSLAPVKNTFIHYPTASSLYRDISRHGCSSPAILINRHSNDGEFEEVRPGYGLQKREDQDSGSVLPQDVPPTSAGEAVLLKLQSDDSECKEVHPGYGVLKREDQDRVAAFSIQLLPTHGGEGLPLERVTAEGRRKPGHRHEAVLLERLNDDSECEEVRPAYRLPERDDRNRIVAFPQKVPPTYSAEVERRRHEEGTCKPCVYFTMKEDGCRLGDNCTFCHICTRESIKEKKQLLKRQSRAAKRAAKRWEAEAYQTEDLWMWPDTWQASSLSLCTPITQSL